MTTSKLLKEIEIFFVFAFFSILGTVTREGITLLSTYPGTYLKGIIWSNFTACLIMGLLTHSKQVWDLIIFTGDLQIKDKEIEGEVDNNDNESNNNDVNKKDNSNSEFVTTHYRRYKTKKEIALFTGMTTGYCGTLSSFSTYMLDLFLGTANIQAGQYYNFPNRAYGLLQFISIFITQIAMSYAGYKYGKHLVTYIEDKLFLLSSLKPSFSIKLVVVYQRIERIIQFLGFLFMVVFLVLSITEKSWRSWTLSFLFSPFGCYLRYYLSAKFNRAPLSSSPATTTNPWKIHFLGTFLANSLACLILSIITILNRGKTSSSSSSTGTSGRIISKLIDCQVLTALANGFCAVLSTVSTFMVELNSLKFMASSYYAIVSVLTGFCLNLVIIGSFNWTVGLEKSPICK